MINSYYYYYYIIELYTIEKHIFRPNAHQNCQYCIFGLMWEFWPENQKVARFAPTSNKRQIDNSKPILVIIHLMSF